MLLFFTKFGACGGANYILGAVQLRGPDRISSPISAFNMPLKFLQLVADRD